MGKCTKDVTPMHWSYVFLALTHRYVTVWCYYNMVNHCEGEICLLSVLTLMYVLLWSLLCCMHYHIIWDRVITAPDFILVSICYYYSYSCSEFQLLYHLQPTFGAGSILEWVCSFTHSSIHSYISPSTHFILLCQHSACWWPSTVRYQQAYWWWLSLGPIMGQDKLDVSIYTTQEGHPCSVLFIVEKYHVNSFPCMLSFFTSIHDTALISCPRDKHSQ